MSAAEYDYIVIGSGPAGLMWVTEIVKEQKKVLLIDSGTYTNSSYSAIDVSLPDTAKQEVGSIGGAARAWQGQCISLTESQFDAIFPLGISWNFGAYKKLQNEVSSLLRIKINHKTQEMNQKISKSIELPKNVLIRFSYIPLRLNWTSIFKKTLCNKNLDFIERRLISLQLTENSVSALFFLDGTILEVTKDTKIVLATSPRNVVDILQSSSKSDKQIFPNLTNRVFDHPWRTFIRFKASKHLILRKNTFKYHFTLGFRMKSKIKFEVFDNSVEIGVFEIRPIFEGSFIYKALVRGSQKLFRRSLLPPKFVDIWAQIAQSEPISISQLKEHITDVGTIQLGAEDERRLKLVEDSARNLLTNIGLKEIKTSNDPALHQAFHPSGNILLGYNPSQFSFNPELKSNTFFNLYIAGASGYKNGSWVNPTFTVLVHSMHNARLSLKS
jgi:hypothetical protein